MSFPAVKLSAVAPIAPLERDLSEQDDCWLLNLDQVEANSGRVLSKLRVEMDEIGSSTHAFGPQHVLYSKLRPNLNKVVVPEEEGYCTSELVPLLPDKERLDRDYLAFYLRSPDFVNWAVSKTAGAKMPRLSMKLFGEQTIPLLPLPTQRHIAKVLEQADCLRRQAQQMEAELDWLVQALFLEMFGNLFANPKQWPLAELGSLIELGPKNGLYKHSNDYGSGTPIVRIDNFYAGELTDPTNFKRVSLTEAEQEKFGLENHSILINRVNSPEYLGKVALVENLPELTVFESNMMNFTVDQSRINPVFLVTQLGSQFIREQIRKASKDASNQSSINQGDVRAFRVVVPPIAEQNRFARLLASTRHVRNMGSERSSMLEQAFQSLMQRAFNGELLPKLA